MRIQINEYLKQLGSQKVLHVPNPGNAGDSVIASATYQTFDRVGLNYTVVRPSLLDARDQIVIYSGGGNLVKATTFSYAYIKKHHALARKFIILPHTIKEVDPLLAEFGGNVDIICRELPSYEYVKEKAPRANVYLDHDMAFNLDVQSFLNDKQYSSLSYLEYISGRYLQGQSISSWSNFALSKKALSIQGNILGSAKSNELNCFRVDGESKGKAPPENNFDLSLLYHFGVESPQISGFCVQTVFRTLKQFSVINTDRLHMAISGALLGLTVNFHANNYYKCRAVYEYSIRDRYPNVIWHED